MDENFVLFDDIRARVSRGERFAVATIIRVAGSAPRGPGTRAVILPSGAIFGTVGGGSLEETVRRAAIDALREEEPIIVEVPLDADDPARAAPVCGGRVHVLLDPWPLMRQDAWTDAAVELGDRQRGVFLTIVRHGPPMHLSHAWLRDTWRPSPENLEKEGLPGLDALREAREGRIPVWHDGPSAKGIVGTLVEPIDPAPRLLIAGGGHIGQALAARANELGFVVTVVDDRKSYVDPGQYPTGVKRRHADMAETVAGLGLDRDDHVVIVTHGHRHDAAALAAALRTPVAYIGMIGSRRKVALIREQLLASGQATAEQLSRVHAPIGLDIGAVTVPEIATSIAAELVLVRRKGAAAAGAPCRKLP